jgi:hypothetical protein
VRFAYFKEKTMKAPQAGIVRGYRVLAGILAASLLSLPASAADWKSMAPLPAYNYLAAAESINGMIYLAGGQSSSGPTSALQAFNPETNAWTLLANMPLTLYQGNGAGVINSQLYVSGGWNGGLPTTALLMYDPPSQYLDDSGRNVAPERLRRDRRHQQQALRHDCL